MKELQTTYSIAAHMVDYSRPPVPSSAVLDAGLSYWKLTHAPDRPSFYVMLHSVPQHDPIILGEWVFICPDIGPVYTIGIADVFPDGRMVVTAWKMQLPRGHDLHRHGYMLLPIDIVVHRTALEPSHVLGMAAYCSWRLMQGVICILYW